MTKPGTSVIDLSGISVVRGGKSILRGVSWRIAHGQRWALLGANGSGKTTLLKVVSGYEWPTTGAVRVLGEQFGRTDIRKLRQRIGWVSNALSERLPGHHTARQIVASGFDASLGLFREILDAEWDRCDELLARLAMARLATQSFDTLSQGEQQRVRIARALANRPALLILDEPCAGLDPVSRRDFLADVARFAASDASPAIILVTHHIEEIGGWVTHGLALREGEPIASGTIAEIIRPETMSRMLGTACRVIRGPEGFHLELAAPSRG